MGIKPSELTLDPGVWKRLQADHRRLQDAYAAASRLPRAERSAADREILISALGGADAVAAAWQRDAARCKELARQLKPEPKPAVTRDYVEMFRRLGIQPDP